MAKKIFFTLFVTGLLLGLFILPKQSSAIAIGLKNVNESIDATAQGAGVKGEIDLFQYVAGLISILLGILGLIFVILLVFSGFQWMTAMGNEEKITKAKKMIINSTIGLIIIFISYSLAYFIFMAITNQPN